MKRIDCDLIGLVLVQQVEINDHVFYFLFHIPTESTDKFVIMVNNVINLRILEQSEIFSRYK